MAESEPLNSDKASNRAFSLENILGNHENLQHPKYREEDKPVSGWDEEVIEKPAVEGFCIECEGWFYFFPVDLGNTLNCGHDGLAKIKQLNCSVKIVETAIAKSVSRHNIEKAPGKDIPRNVCKL